MYAIDLEKETVSEVFLRLNSQVSAQNSLAYYMNYARIGSEEYYGNGWLIWWHQRNLNIFTNTAALTEGKKEERILLLIGAAHKGILEQFFENSKAFDVVNTLSYLEKLLCLKSIKPSPFRKLFFHRPLWLSFCNTHRKKTYQFITFRHI